MRILITGAKGNLGRALLKALPTRGHDVLGTDMDEVDITDYGAVLALVERTQPQIVIHCAAMTAVDRCALEPDLALRINGIGSHNVALACAANGASICQISTNEVFKRASNLPILEYDTPNPANPYGYSKWYGEQMVRDVLPQHYIVRISWLFAHGGSNFLQKIVAAAAVGKPISVVVDEIAAPTYTEDLVPALADLISTGRYGIYHLVNQGYASRYEMARVALDCCGYAATPIKPILSAEFARPSRPPTYSVLRNFLGAELGITLRDWREAVAAFFAEERKHAPDA